MEIEIIRAAKIIHAMKLAYQSEKGAIGLDGEMIDAPMIKQVSSACRSAFRQTDIFRRKTRSKLHSLQD